MMMKVAFLWILIIAASLALEANGDATKYTAMYVFGDSLTDAGNNKYFIDSIAKADHLPYGIDFSGGPTGRFSNGKILVDFIAEMVGLPLLPSYADVVAKGDSILFGVNYASAAAGILRDTGYQFGRVIPFEEQINNLRKTLGQLRGQLHENEVSKYLANALVFVDIGANDYFNNYLQAEYYPSSHIYNLEQFADLLMTLYRKHILEIQGLGLRKFLILEASPIGCAPITIHNMKCNATLNHIVAMFNTRLKSVVHDLKSNHPGSTFSYAPSFQIFTSLFDNAEAYGFKVKDSACCGGRDGSNGTKPRCSKDTVICPNRNEYLFWDAAHATEAGNRILAALLRNTTSF
ncbi:GDSL esterase/lipase At5g08460-like [Salvia hispanica]|uniref:GDSL esterase/lipase At5g08460-like n=1 Tax=Salvia hispanica TaxID=49212 RepID=UPI002009D559|nr:GDSL esterase/lipase At5g08460-like [Salvia hispanica]